jgi:tRNA U34 5-methylaminomethyl-2-thiouridine-forming methyltransferase MnmC
LKIRADFTQPELNLTGKFDIIYFDAFGPDKQPEMWKAELLLNLFEITKNNGVFVTYSAKGKVRRNLAAAGYSVERLPGPPGKKQMLRAIKVIA